MERQYTPLSECGADDDDVGSPLHVYHHNYFESASYIRRIGVHMITIEDVSLQVT